MLFRRWAPLELQCLRQLSPCKKQATRCRWSFLYHRARFQVNIKRNLLFDDKRGRRAITTHQRSGRNSRLESCLHRHTKRIHPSTDGVSLCHSSMYIVMSRITASQLEMECLSAILLLHAQDHSILPSTEKSLGRRAHLATRCALDVVRRLHAVVALSMYSIHCRERTKARKFGSDVVRACQNARAHVSAGRLHRGDVRLPAIFWCRRDCDPRYPNQNKRPHTPSMGPSTSVLPSPRYKMEVRSDTAHTICPPKRKLFKLHRHPVSVPPGLPRGSPVESRSCEKRLCLSCQEFVSATETSRNNCVQNDA